MKTYRIYINELFYLQQQYLILLDKNNIICEAHDELINNYGILLDGNDKLINRHYSVMTEEDAFYFKLKYPQI